MKTCNKMESDLKTLEARLAIYERALTDFNEKSWSSNIRKGFCHYFLVVCRIDVYGTDMKEKLPELYLQKPEFSSDGRWDYWFPRAYVESRIQCLLKAIELTKELILKQSQDVK